MTSYQPTHTVPGIVQWCTRDPTATAPRSQKWGTSRREVAQDKEDVYSFLPDTAPLLPSIWLQLM